MGARYYQYFIVWRQYEDLLGFHNKDGCEFLVGSDSNEVPEMNSVIYQRLAALCDTHIENVEFQQFLNGNPPKQIIPDFGYDNKELHEMTIPERLIEVDEIVISDSYACWQLGRKDIFVVPTETMARTAYHFHL